MKTPAQGLQAQVEGMGDPGGLGTRRASWVLGAPPRPQGSRQWGQVPSLRAWQSPQGWEEGMEPPEEDWGQPAAPCTWARRVSPPGSGYLAWQSCPRLQARPSYWASMLSSLCWMPLELFQAPGEDMSRLARQSHAPAHRALPAGASWPCVLW